MKAHPYPQTHGYIALASVLVISAVAVVIATTVSLLSISEAQMSLAAEKSDQALNFVESCVEDALLRLNETNAIPAAIPLPQGSCSVTIDSQVGTAWTFTTTGTLENYTKSIQVQLTRTTTITITSWKQL